MEEQARLRNCIKSCTQWNWPREEKVWPNHQEEGTTFKNVMVLRSRRVTLKESLCPRRSPELCQLAPQLRVIWRQVFPLEPLTATAFTAPLPPTFESITILKLPWPLIVNLTPPLLLHPTLQNMTHYKFSKRIWMMLYLYVTELLTHYFFYKKNNFNEMG